MSIEVYKASAGSGKTYTLVYEYIKFLFEAYSHYVKSDLGHALNLHRRVLAVTFTNKATAEMKERIVKSLYELSEGAKKDYVKKLEQDIPSLIPADIPHIAQILLTDILQDYTQFRVSTIDGFFQQIVRSFARELNLNNQYKVELEQDRILELAVDNMLSSLGDENKKSLLEWLTDFASEQVEDAKSWNPRGKILKLAQLISSEEYVSQKEKFGFDLSKLISYRTHIRNIIKRFKDDLKQVCDVAQNILKSIDADNILIKNHISYLNYDHLDKNDYVVSSTFEKGAYSDDLNMWCKAKFKNL